MTDKDRIAGLPAGPHPDGEGTGKASDDQTLQHRRQFLIGLGKWSQAVIAGATFGAAALAGSRDAGAWLNSRGGAGWINGSASWINGGGAWINGSGWVNHAGNWINHTGGGWINGGGGHGAGWVNRRGGGGWVNRRGGGGWWNA